jgi:hypothetical protein
LADPVTTFCALEHAAREEIIACGGYVLVYIDGSLEFLLIFFIASVNLWISLFDFFFISFILCFEWLLI